MIAFIRRLKAAYAVYNLFHRKELIHNTALFKKYGKGELRKETYYKEISGVPVMETIKRIFGNDHDEAGLKSLLNEKEDFYRKEYAPYVAPVNGLENFLTGLKNAGIKMAMATSATVFLDFASVAVVHSIYFPN